MAVSPHNNAAAQAIKRELDVALLCCDRLAADLRKARNTVARIESDLREKNKAAATLKSQLAESLEGCVRQVFSLSFTANESKIPKYVSIAAPDRHHTSKTETDEVLLVVCTYELAADRDNGKASLVRRTNMSESRIATNDIDFKAGSLQ